MRKWGRKVRRLTTETPESNYEWLHNMITIKNREVYLKDYSDDGDLSLIDYCRNECKRECDIDINADVEEFGEYMDCDCIVSLFYHMAVGHAELRSHLKAYEDTGLSPEEIVKRVNMFDAIHESYKKANKYITELQEQNDTLADTVNMLSPSIMETHELKTLNRELVQTLKKLYDMYGTKPIEQYEYCILENAKKLIEGVE